MDDEPSICAAYARPVRSAKMMPHTFESIETFLRSEFADENACVVSDIQFPGTNGLDLPVLPRRAGRSLPVIFVTDQDTDDTRERAQPLGAAAYFRSPVDNQALLDAIVWAIG